MIGSPLTNLEHPRTVRTPPIILSTALLALSCACMKTPGVSGGHLIERTRVSMGTQLHLTAWTGDDVAAASAFDAVFAEFDRLENLMSVWRPVSDVVRLNAAAGDHAVPVSPEVREVLRIARQVSEWTDG